MTFWLIIGALTLAVLGIMARAVLKLTPEDGESSEITSDMQVYRDQLKELDRDLSRGTIGKEDAERARIEISRRLLDADRAAQAATRAGDAPQNASRLALGLTAALLACGSFGLYWTMGSPGYPDFGRAKRLAMSQEMRDTRPSQAEVEAGLAPWPGPPAEAPEDYLNLIEELRKAVAKRPDDPRGLELLAQHESALGNYVAGHNATAQLLAIKGENASVEDYVRHADLLVNAAEGFVSPEAEAALRAALERAPRHQLARYYTGLMFAQNARPDLAFRMWRALLEEGPKDAPWWPAIRSQITGVAQLAGEDYTPPALETTPALRGPTADEMEAAADMSPEDRAAMIQGMIDQLSERLATEGGGPEEWARLINALGVTGQAERAMAIWNEAQTRFADAPEALEIVREAARLVEIAK